jgi:flagellar basal-body rod protein FlgF
MDQLTSTAASGMRTRSEALDLIANNISNASATGYKSDSEYYNLYTSFDADTQSTMPTIERAWTNFSQGLLSDTGNPLDIALAGRGFLTADSPHGTVYTRNGSLKLSSTGILETAEGYPVRANTPSGHIQATLGVGAGILQFQKDGSVAQDGQPLGTLTIADWPHPEKLDKQSGAYFRMADSSAQPAAATGVEVWQGKLEGSNSSPAEAAVQLVSVLRQFEMLQKAVSLGAQMNKQAAEDVARVSG